MTPSDRPLITVTYAQTLDGRLATRSGSSQWISGPESLRFSHALRARHDAVMVGVGTVLRDDPRLTVRHVPGRDPLRVVVDSALRTSLTAAVLTGGQAAGTVLATTTQASAERHAAAEALGATVLTLPADTAGRVNLAALVSALSGRGVETLLVEGGARLITALLRARLVDQLAVCVAPKILGSGVEAIGDLGIDDLDDAMTLDQPRMTAYGADIVVEGRVIYRSSDAG